MLKSERQKVIEKEKQQEKERIQLQNLLKQKNRELEDPKYSKEQSYSFAKEKTRQNIAELTSLAERMNLKEIKTYLHFEKTSRNFVSEERKSAIVESLRILEEVETIQTQKKLQETAIAKKFLRYLLSTYIAFHKFIGSEKLTESKSNKSTLSGLGIKVQQKD